MTYLQVRAKAAGTKQSVVDRIVLHATVSPCKPGGARANARWFQDPKANVSAHYVIDPGEVVQCVPDDVVAYHAPPNARSLGVELCDPQEGDDTRWYDDAHTQMLLRAATVVADLCKRHDVPLVYVGYAGLRKGLRGITTHAQVSRAWKLSSHSDPGPAFPMARFLALVGQAMNPPSTTPKENEMTPAQEAKLDRALELLEALVAPRTQDKVDPDPHHISLGDVLTKVENETP